MTASPVPVANLFAMWPKLWPLLEPAYRRSSEKADLLAGIMARNFQLWAVNEAGTNVPIAGIVSTLRKSVEGTSSGQLHARIWLVGGSRLSQWASDFLSVFIPWAKSQGATSIMGAGRPGWARIVARFGGERVPDEDGMPAWRLPI